MSRRNEIERSRYFGIEVEILMVMSHCSLVRHEGRDFVVDTADLISLQTLGQAA